MRKIARMAVVLLFPACVGFLFPQEVGYFLEGLPHEREVEAKVVVVPEGNGSKLLLYEIFFRADEPFTFPPCPTCYDPPQPCKG